MALRLGEPAPVFAREVMQSGNASLKRSIEEVVRSIRFGISDVEYARLARGWAGQVLIAAGKPKGVRAQTQAILDAARGQTMYVADPVHMEWIQTAVRTLCLKPGQCNPIEDCDGLTVVMGTICPLIGIPVQLIEQHWENAEQDHILVAVRDEYGTWLKVDPSTDWPVGRAATADREIWIDPMQDVTPQLVALGRIRVIREMRFGKVWESHDGGSSWAEVNLGAIGRLGATPYDGPEVDLNNQVVAAAAAGDTYLSQGDYKGAITAYQAAGMAGATSVGPEIDLVGMPNVTQPFTQQAWQLNAALAAVNNGSGQPQPVPGVPGGFTHPPGAPPTAADANSAKSLIGQMISLYTQAIAAGRRAVAGGGAIVPAGGASSDNVGALKALGVAAGVGAVVGIGWHFWQKSRGRRRRR